MTEQEILKIIEENKKDLGFWKIAFMKDPSTVVGDVIGIWFNTNIDKYEVYQMIHGDLISKTVTKSKSDAFEDCRLYNNERSR